MAEERKPKIDLKARLGKTPAPAPVAPTGGAQPAVGGAAAPMAPPPVQSSSALPGVPVGPPPGYTPSPSSRPVLDPSHPLAAAVGVAPYRASAPAPAMAPTRIEVDEMAVQQAARGASRKGFIAGSVLAIVLGCVGYVAGQSVEQGAGRTKSKADAAELAANVEKAKKALTQLSEMMDKGSKSLLTERKFPDTLAKDLGGINVDFDGTQLAGRRFSGFPQETTHGLVEFITAVQGVNDRKLLIQGLLTKLQKPITEQLAIPPGQLKVGYVVAVDKDPSGNLAGFLSPLSAPIPVTAQNIALPAKLTFANPFGSGNTELPRYAGGDIATKPAAIYVVPKTFDTVCPSAQGGQIAQLGAQIGEFVRSIKGEAQPTAGEDTVQDSKPGLIERADKLINGLNKI